MKIVDASYEILTQRNDDLYLRNIERISRVCYKSEDKMTRDNSSAIDLIAKLVENGHGAMIEHSQMSVLFTVNRGVSHELVRHRIASFAQESTRYCNYSKDKFGHGITFIRPCTLKEGTLAYNIWYDSMLAAERYYLDLIDHGCTPQEARDVLPHATKTDIVMTANYWEWRHVFKVRTSKTAHPHMREVMIPLYKEVREMFPFIFDGIGKDWFDERRREVRHTNDEIDINDTGVGINRG